MKIILGVYDKPGIYDRYTVVFSGKSTPGHFNMLSMSEDPHMPNGVCSHCEGVYDVHGLNSHLGKKIELTDLPAVCTREVVKELGGVTHTSTLIKENNDKLHRNRPVWC